MPTKPFDWTSPRMVAIASVGCIFFGAIACGSEPSEITLSPVGTGPGVVSVEPLAIPSGVSPSHEGTLVMAGSYPVEVVPHASGEVYAYVHGDAPPPPASTELAVVVPVTGGVRTVELEWDPGERRWGGHLRHVEIVPGPVDVVLVVDGARWAARSPTFVVLPAVVVVAPVVVAPVVVAPAPVVVVPVVEYEVEYEGKHRKHRGWGHGHGGGHGIRFRH
jgi:hypothetical protein